MTSPIPDEQLVELWRLEAEATPGPWAPCSTHPYEIDQLVLHRGTGALGVYPGSATVVAADDEENGHAGCGTEADAALIAAARNAIPGLRARLERAEAKLRDVRREVEELVGDHHHSVQYENEVQFEALQETFARLGITEES